MGKKEEKKQVNCFNSWKAFLKMLKIITDKYELEEKKEWYKQLKFLEEYVNLRKCLLMKIYTNYMNIYRYVYDMNNNLIRIEVKEMDE